MKESTKIGLAVAAAVVTAPAWLPLVWLFDWLDGDYYRDGYDSGGSADIGGTTTQRARWERQGYKDKGWR